MGQRGRTAGCRQEADCGKFLTGWTGRRGMVSGFESVTDMGKDKKQDGSCVYFLFDR